MPPQHPHEIIRRQNVLLLCERFVKCLMARRWFRRPFQVKSASGGSKVGQTLVAVVMVDNRTGQL